MRHRLWLLGAMVAATATAGEPARTLEERHATDGVTTVRVAAGVGEIEILAGEYENVGVRVEVSLTSRSARTSRRSRRELEEVQLVAERRGDDLELRLHPRRRRFEWREQWSIRLPAHLAAAVELGVGDVRVVDVAGDLSIEVGVGQVRIDGAYAAFGPIAASCGVGDVTLRTPSGRERGSGFIARSLQSRGPGTATLEAETGVGDIDIRLR